MRLSGDDGQEMLVRRITIKLNRPTRDKETEIHLLTNLPQRVTGQQIATAYLSRWKIENAFHKLTMVLRCELNTLGYPQAALFGFCLAVAMYNVVHTVIAALRAAHPDALETTAGKAAKFSFYYLADEIAGVSRGMALVVAAEHWTKAFAQKNAPADGQAIALAGTQSPCGTVSDQSRRRKETESKATDKTWRTRFNAADTTEPETHPQRTIKMTALKD